MTALWGLAERDMARGCLVAAWLILLIGIGIGVVTTKACASGWRVQSPITRGAK